MTSGVMIIFMCLGRYVRFSHFSGLAGVGAGPATASPGGGVATAATGQPTSTTATPGGSGQGTGKEAFEPLELNYLQLLGQEVLVSDF